MNISQDAVQEFKVFRNQFDAQYGAALAAVVTVATKSGTNELHGTGYFFGRDDSFNARNAFQQQQAGLRPAAHRRIGSAGRSASNRTHFFGAYEYTHVDKENIIALPASAIPFATRENGAFPARTREHLRGREGGSPVDRAAVVLRPLRLRRPVGDAHRHRARRTRPTSTTRSKMHSLIGEHNWVLSNTTVNTLRAHYMWNEVATLPVTLGVGPARCRPSVTTGQNWTSPQFFPRTRLQIFDTLYKTLGRHDVKFGGDYTYATHNYDAHFYESG